LTPNYTKPETTNVSILKFDVQNTNSTDALNLTQVNVTYNGTTIKDIDSVLVLNSISGHTIAANTSIDTSQNVIRIDTSSAAQLGPDSAQNFTVSFNISTNAAHGNVTDGNSTGIVGDPLNGTSIQTVETLPIDPTGNTTIDGNAPTITPGSTGYPTGQTRAKDNDTITLKSNISDSDSGVKNVTVDASPINSSLGDINLTHESNDTWTNSSVVVNTTTGTYDLNVTTYDDVGNSNTSTNALTVEVDNDDPTYYWINRPTSVKPGTRSR